MGKRDMIATRTTVLDIVGLDYDVEKATFFATTGKIRTPHTLQIYVRALGRLEGFSVCRGIAVLAMRAQDADDFAYTLAAEGRTPASVRQDLSACSSFFTFLKRHAETIHNPFRGATVRTAKKTTRAFAYPDTEELERILEALCPTTRAAAVVIADRGLRAWALPSLTIMAGRFTAQSQGKDITGALPTEALTAIL
jgi:site-specific recombinase XerD